MATEERLNLTVSGRVQGVGYRYTVQVEATSLGVRGYVRNQKDGSVFVAAQGEPEAVERLVRRCYQGPSAADVKEIKILPGKLEDFRDFSIRY